MYQETSSGQGDSIPPLQSAECEITEECAIAYAEMPVVPPSGGDFHSIFIVNNDAIDALIAIIIGDLSGHGPERTEQAATLRDTIADCLRRGMPPSETLETVNAEAEQSDDFTGFATAFVAVLAPNTGRLTYANAGHEPGLIAVCSDSTSTAIYVLDATGPPIGVIPPEMVSYYDSEAFLPERGTLLLYTDGISEASPFEYHDELLGVDRLMEMFARLGYLPPGQLVTTLADQVLEYANQHLHDDFVLLAVQRKPAPS